MADETPPAKDPFVPEKRPMDRRTFVKTAVGVAAVGAVGATTAGLVVPLSTSGGLKIKRFPYLGAKKTGGPAPQGIPLIPLKINDAGNVEGVPALESAGHSLEWYKYCAHEAAPGLDPDFTDDNVLRYFNNPEKVKKAAAELGQALWYAEKLNEPMRASDFPGVGLGAPFRWRSEDQEGTNIITGICIRVKADEIRGKAEPFLAKLPDGTALIAFCSFCAHFCCVPGFKESNQAIAADAFENIFCTCHGSIYDPHDIKEYTFPPNM